MRFAAAARFLAHFESVKRDPKKPDGDSRHWAVSPQSKDPKDLLHDSQPAGHSVVPWDPLDPKELLATKTRSYSQGLLLNQKSSWEGVLRNNFRKQKKRGHPVEENHAKQLCDPTSDEADVGLLSCGFNYYCAESRDSNLGGVCVEVLMDRSSHHRRLEDSEAEDIDFVTACNPSSPYFSQCDCTMFDTVSGSGYINCSLSNYQNYCFEPDLCPTLCFDLSVNSQITSNVTDSTTYCYDFVGSYEREICSTYSENGCSISFDGATCNSCEPVNCTGVESGDYIAWDCTNIPNGTQGSDCNNADIFIPAAQDCLEQNLAFSPAPNATVAPNASAVPSANASAVPSAAPSAVPSANASASEAPSAGRTSAPVVEEPDVVTPAPVVEPTKEPTAVVTNAPVVAAPPPTPPTSGSVHFGAGSSVLILLTSLVAGIAIALVTGG